MSDEEPLFEAASGAAAPTLHASAGRWTMAYSEWDGAEWSIAFAESRDGTRWQRTLARVHLEKALSPMIPSDRRASPCSGNRRLPGSW